MILQADARAIPLADGSVHMVCTSPPYWGLRSYLDNGDPLKARELGLEPTPEEYVAHMVEVFREVWRVLRDDGTCWVNLGDSYASNWPSPNRRNIIGNLESAGKRSNRPPHMGNGLKDKDLVGIPWRLAFALQADGWYLRSEITWCKRAPMPESVTDRPTSATEKVFLFAKSSKYFYDAEAVKEPSESGPSDQRKILEGYERFGGRAKTPEDPFNKASSSTNIGTHAGVGSPNGRNMRNYWLLGPSRFEGAHFATFPRKLVESSIQAGTSARGCCKACGAPWERVTERTAEHYNGKEAEQRRRRNFGACSGGTEKVTLGVTDGVHVTTTGWRPTCACQEIYCATCDLVLDYRHDTHTSRTKHHMSGLRDSVSCGQDLPEVLQSYVLQDDTEETEGSSLPTVREGVSPKVSQVGVLQQELFQQMGSNPQTELQGLPQEQGRLRYDLRPDSSQGVEDGLHHGASPCDGGGFEPSVTQERGCPPQEWEQVGQPGGESSGGGEEQARHDEESEVHGDVSVLPVRLSNSRTCPHCGSELTVRPPDTKPAIVLDIFGGSMTTVSVAEELGRRAIGLDLKWEYLKLGAARMRGTLRGLAL